MVLSALNLRGAFVARSWWFLHLRLCLSSVVPLLLYWFLVSVSGGFCGPF